jgi:chaperonin GroES
MTQFEPLGDRVLIRPKRQDEMTEGGLYIPDMAKDRPMEGYVVAVGPGDGETDINIEAGDRVLYSRYAGTDIVLDGQEYLILAAGDILGKIKMEDVDAISLGATA